MTAGTDAHTMIVRIINHTAVIFSAMIQSEEFRYINIKLRLPVTANFLQRVGEADPVLDGLKFLSSS